MATDSKRVQELKQKIRDLENQIPAHSLPPSMLQTLEELEDALALELKKFELEGESNA